MRNISVFGTSVYLIASNTHPIGMKIDAFADDADPITIQPFSVREMAMDLNGSPISWAVGGILQLSISVIPNSSDDEDLYVLLNANRASGFAMPKRDEISLILNYPDNSVKIFSKGRILSGPPSSGASASGRMTTNTYGFGFASVTTISAKAAIYSALGLLTK